VILVARPAYEDLTARARIRDAALTLFAERGMDGTTIRDIAKAAGVSSGLVRHHFGSKEGLRDACDSYALERLVNFKEQAILEGHIADTGFLSTIHPTVLWLYRYLARALVDGSPAAAAMYDDIVGIGEAWIKQHMPDVTDDPRAFSALLCAMQIGMLGMHQPLSNALGADILSPDGNLRLMRAMVDFHSTTLLTPEQAALMRRALDQFPPGQSTQERSTMDNPGASPTPAEGATR
jgi:AcrR family transcriptional regulator